MNWGKGIDLLFLYKKIQLMPFLCHYTSKSGNGIILEHAGYTPDNLGEVLHLNHDPVWDRSHFYDNWTGTENMYLVHGHTPVQYLKFNYGYNGQEPFTQEDLKFKRTWDLNSTYKPEVIRYCDGHKFDIDMCTIVSGRIALLDLDTFEVIYFDEGEKE